LAAESWGNIPLWDLESNKVRILKPDKAMSTMVRPQFSFDGSLYSVHNNGNVYQWDLQRDTHRLIATGCGDIFFVAKNSPDLFVCVGGSGGGDREITTELKVIDVRKGKSYPILTHGNRVSAVAVDPSGKILVTGDIDGIVRVGPITGEEPHLLFGHHDIIGSVAVDPELRWIASSEMDNAVIRMWAMPTGKPLQTLPYDELLKKLSSLSNVRVVDDAKDPSGYRLQMDPFPGWKNVPTW